MRIQSNMPAVNASGLMVVNTARQAKSIEKLSSGRRVNRSADDAAGLAISEKMRAQIRGLNQANRNINDGINLLKTAEGALQSVCDIIQRMRELAVQAASDTNENTIDRAALDKEYQQLKREIDDFASKTEFNGMKLIDGSFEKDKFSHFIEFLYALTAGIGNNHPIPMTGAAYSFSASITPQAPITVTDWQPVPTVPTVPVAPATPSPPAAPTAPAPVIITPAGDETDIPDHPTVTTPLHIINDNADVGTNSTTLYITGDNASVINNNAYLGITGSDASVEDNNATLDIIGSGADVKNNYGTAKIHGIKTSIHNNVTGGIIEIVGDEAEITTNSGNVRINGKNASIVTNVSGGTADITGDGAEITTNNGTAKIHGDEAIVTNNNNTLEITGGAAEIVDNNGITRIGGDRAVIQNNNINGNVIINGDEANIGNNRGTSRIFGDRAVIGTNISGGEVEIVGENAEITTNDGVVGVFGNDAHLNENNGTARVSGNGALIGTNYSGRTVEITGGNGKVEENYGIVDITGYNARVENNYAGGVARLFGGSGGDTSVGVNYVNGSVYVAQTTGAFTIGSNFGYLVTQSRTVNIERNESTGTTRINEASIINVTTNAGRIEVMNSPANTDFRVSTNSSTGRISTNADYNRVTGNAGIIVVTGGKIDLSEISTNTGTITITPGASVITQGDFYSDIFRGTNTMQGRIQIEGPGPRMSGAGARFNVGGSGRLDLYSGASEYISANGGSIYAGDASGADVTTNNGNIYAFNLSRADVGTSSGVIEVSDSSTANIAVNNGSAYADYYSSLNIGTNNGRSVKINQNSTAAVNVNNGKIEANNNSRVIIMGGNGWNYGEVYLFENSTATINLNGRGLAGTGWVEINADASATITTNEGYIRNFNTSPTAAIVMDNTVNGIIDNYGRMEVMNNAIADNLRHHVYYDSSDAGCPPGGIDTSGISPLVTNGVLPKEAQYLTVYANGQSYTLEAFWAEIPHQECNLDDNGIVNKDINCNDKIFQLVFSGFTDDGGRITFDSNDAYVVSGTQYGIRLDDNTGSVWPYELKNPYSPYPDIPNDSSVPPDGSNRSGFFLVYQALVRQESVYKEGRPLVIQSGANEGDATPLWLGNISTSLLGDKTGESNMFEICGCQTLRQSQIININFARRAIKISNAALVQVTSMRAMIGAQQNRLEHKLASVDISAENLQNAESRIRDADIAKEMSEFTRSNILSKSSTAMLAQANALPQSVLRVLGSE